MSYGVDLDWLPLGAGGHFVRFNGRVYEACDAAIHHRSRGELYHSALEVHVPSGRFVIEQTPVPDGRDGAIPYLSEAVESPRSLTADPDVARRLLDLVPSVPTLVWGRDEVHAGEMWNSNSIIAWVIVSAGLDVAEGRLPERGRAPGWQAGITVASRAERFVSALTSGCGRTEILRCYHGIPTRSTRDIIAVDTERLPCGR